MGYQAKKTRYETMKYRRCGESGLLLPVMSLGMWHNFGSADPYEKSKEILLGAFDMGMTYFDLANNYGPQAGSAEETLGKILKEELSSYRDEMIIATKAGYEMWPGPYGNFGSKKSLIASLDQSLHRMGVDYVDIFYHHRPDPETPLEETVEALVQAVKSGKALYVGISNYNRTQTDRMVKILADNGVHCLVHQFRYSMIDRENEEVLLNLSDWHMGGVAFSPLAQGILTGKYINGIPTDSRAAGTSQFLDADSITESAVKITKDLTKIAEERGQNLSQMALAWLLHYEQMTSVILGVSRLEQLEENVQAIHNIEFSEEELEHIKLILNQI